MARTRRRKLPLGRQILATLDDITELIGATTHPDRIKELLVQYKKLNEELGDLVDKNINKASEEYKSATIGLTEASEIIRDSIKGMESVAKTIQAIAKAAELVAKVI